MLNPSKRLYYFASGLRSLAHLPARAELFSRSAIACQQMSLSSGILRLSRSREWEAFEAPDNQAVVERLLELCGIGRWSAGYVPLRWLGRLDVYPGDDVGARNNLKCWLGLQKTLDYEGVRRITAKWQPYAGLVYFHMLLDRLAAAGHLGPDSWAGEPGGAK